MSDFQFIVPVLSLVDERYAPLEELIGAHLAWLKSHGADGILVMGTTGEFPNFSVAQRIRYLDAVLACNPGLDVMVNIGAAALADVLALQSHALSSDGVHRILWMPPFYYADTSINGLPETLALVLKEQPAEIPFLLYHYPKMSQVNITPELINQFPQVAGLKDTSGDMERVADLVKRLPDRQVYVGTDYEMQESRSLGCAGVISGLSNIFPKLAYEAIQGSLPKEQTLHRLRELLPASAKIPAMKAYLNHLNLSAQKTVSTLPFVDLPLPAETQLVKLLLNTISEGYTHAG